MKKHFEFSKLIIIPETILIWYISFKTLKYIGMVIESGYTGTLPYLTTLLTVAFTAYGTSVSFYYNKAKGENIKKIEIASSSNVDVDCDPIVIDDL